MFLAKGSLNLSNKKKIKIKAHMLNKDAFFFLFIEMFPNFQEKAKILLEKIFNVTYFLK